MFFLPGVFGSVFVHHRFVKLMGMLGYGVDPWFLFAHKLKSPMVTYVVSSSVYFFGTTLEEGITVVFLSKSLIMVIFH
jgi:extradiol dioxygenase family protein